MIEAISPVVINDERLKGHIIISLSAFGAPIVGRHMDEVKRLECERGRKQYILNLRISIFDELSIVSRENSHV